jgi:hypothetical protein
MLVVEVVVVVVVVVGSVGDVGVVLQAGRKAAQMITPSAVTDGHRVMSRSQ